MDIATTDCGIVVGTLTGASSLHHARAGVVHVIEWAQVRGHYQVLVDVTGATGIAVPSLAARFDMTHQFARAAGHGMALALVAPEILLDEERVGVVVAVRMGLRAYTTDTNADAMAWLRAQKRITNAWKPTAAANT